MKNIVRFWIFGDFAKNAVVFAGTKEVYAETSHFAH